MALNSIFGQQQAPQQQLGGLGALAQGIGSILDLFGAKKPKFNYGPTPAESQAMSLIMAMNDPNNSLVQHNTQQNLQKGMQDFLMQLKQIQMMNARGQARGQRPFIFSPERADETIDYLTTRGLPAITERARETAKSDIGRQAEALTGIANIEKQRQDQTNATKKSDYALFSGQGGFGGLGGALGNGVQNFLQRIMAPELPTPRFPWQTREYPVNPFAFPWSHQ